MKVHHVAVTVNNLEESVIFYIQVLGFEIVKKFSREDMCAYATFVKLNDFQIELWQFQNMKENLNSLNDIKVRGIRHIAFEVDDLKETISKLTKKGLKFSKPKLGASNHNYSFTTDPNGVALEFYEK
jgi:glyoxylase I family protein